jgi:hypothetical protein
MNMAVFTAEAVMAVPIMTMVDPMNMPARLPQ